MKIQQTNLAEKDRVSTLQETLRVEGNRLGGITSITGSELVTLVLNTVSKSGQIFITPLENEHYSSITPHLAEAHWQERILHDMFGLIPDGHPRLKGSLLHETYSNSFFPLSSTIAENPESAERIYQSMKVRGDGIYEVPVGPIHAGIIEPGHFHLSCLGEIVFNLEIRLGYLHRGIEKRVVETPISKQRFVVESAASDAATAYALAHATLIENFFRVAAPLRALFLRSLVLEIERVAMHLNDLSGMAGDIGYVAVASSFGRQRGVALKMAELICGSRLLRGFVCPGGVTREPDKYLIQVESLAKTLQKELPSLFYAFLRNQVAADRMDRIGRLAKNLASDFGVVGPTARASGLNYDARAHFVHGIYPHMVPKIPTMDDGDILSRTKLRMAEITSSLNLILELISHAPKGSILTPLPESLPADEVAVSVVESHRGELIHMAFTDSSGNLKRYWIKDPSVNNWTALAIAVRNNLLSDFPLCNKSFSLSYGGHDL